MGRPHSSDLRQRFVAAPEDGMSAGAAGRRMRIARATAVRWAGTWQLEGRAEALPMGEDPRAEALEAQALQILGRLADKFDLLLGEIVSRLAGEGVDTSAASVSRPLTRHGITHKKHGRRSRADGRGHGPRPRRTARGDDGTGPLKARLHR